MFDLIGWRTLRTVALVMCVLILQACKTELYSGLNERQANQMISVLMKHGIEARRESTKDGSLTVMVDEERFASAVQVLEAAGLPQAHFDSLGDVFKGNGLVASPIQERAQLVYAMSQELSNTVAQVDGIRTARVHVDLPDTDLRSKETRPASAAVFVRYEASVDVEPLIPKIKSLVAGSISGLDYERVSVIPVAVSVEEIAAEPKMASWLGVPVPEHSVGRLAQWSLLIWLLAAIVAGGGTWWFMTRSARGTRIYRQAS
ncbi:type III secretion system inner membrane ring lipoprotein SctJ [Bordetella tumulicola]|uniref:type III secretion system inner membrane ring lipoprotein SctJ n=1 Tax=Bordetella tumulicola TaxID=1649133 RepID=UPI0039EE0338